MARVNAILAVVSLAAIQLSCGTGVKSGSMAGKENPQVRAVDHMVPHVSTVPANKGEKVQLYVREKFVRRCNRQAGGADGSWRLLAVNARLRCGTGGLQLDVLSCQRRLRRFRHRYDWLW